MLYQFVPYTVFLVASAMMTFALALLFEAIGAYSQDGQRIVEEISVIKTFDDGKDALAEYAEQHKKDKSREIYVYHTANENLKIAERKWIGVRAYGQIGT